MVCSSSQNSGSRNERTAAGHGNGNMSDAGSGTDGPAASTGVAEAIGEPRTRSGGPPAAAATAQQRAGDGPAADGSDLTDDGEPLLVKIQRLKSEQAEVRKARLKVSKDLKNAERRRSRLRKRARQLSDADLKAVLEMRETIAEAAPPTAVGDVRPASAGSAGSGSHDATS